MLELHNLSMRFGGLEVTRGVSMRLAPGECRVVLGPNGAGKTTLFDLLTGSLRPSEGKIFLDDKDITALSMSARSRLGVARSYQKNNLFEAFSVAENLALALVTGEGRGASLFRRYHRHPRIQHRIEELAELVGLSGALQTPVAAASYGMRRQLEIGLALACNPKLLLLDEPTSGVGAEQVRGFQELIHRLPPQLTVLVIEHDLDLAFAIADQIIVLDQGQVVFDGTAAAARKNAQVRRIYLGEWGGHG